MKKGKKMWQKNFKLDEFMLNLIFVSEHRCSILEYRRHYSEGCMTSSKEEVRSTYGERDGRVSTKRHKTKTTLLSTYGERDGRVSTKRHKIKMTLLSTYGERETVE